MEITRKGIPTTIAGTQPKIGEPAPAFQLKDRNQNTVTLDDFKGKKVLLSVFPDINTRVCDLQTVHFFKLAATLPDTQILNISNNDIETLDAWCATKDIDALMIHDDGSFAQDYGLWMPEFKVLARSVFVIDEAGVLQYMEIVPEMAQEPDYQKAIDAVQHQ